MQLRGIEKKIECARKFLDKLNAQASSNQVKYEVVTGSVMPVLEE